MPYLWPEQAKSIDTDCEELFARTALSPGVLNRIVCKLALMALNDTHRRYEDYSRILGAIQDAHDEIQRRVMFPYENKKAEENGDLFDDFVNRGNQ